MSWRLSSKNLYRFVLAIALLGLVLPAGAQTNEERGDRGIVVTPAQPDSDDTAPEKQPTGLTDKALPPLAESLPGGDITAVSRVRVNRVALEGNTVLPVDVVDSLLVEFENRVVSMEELQELRFKLTALYVQNGYVSSGVVLPDQRLDGGVVRLMAVEGQVTRIAIFGNYTIRDGYIESRVGRGIGVPVHTGDLQTALNVLRSDPRIARINAKLLPGARPGESTLQVNVTEHANWWVSTAFDNYRSPSVDENRISISAGNSNFTGNGDVLALDYRVTDGLDDYDFSYSYPLTAADLRLAGYYGSTDSNIVEEPFNIIDIVSKSETIGIALSRPFRSRSNRVFTATLGVENRNAENWLLGMPFSFTPGEQDGQSEVSVAYLGGQMLWPSPNQMIGVTLTGRFGVDLMDPTINAEGPDSEFFALQAQFQYARRLAWRNSEVIVRSSSQFASTSLLALEKFSVGGHTTVRGYRENSLVRDSGVIVSLEMQIPLFVDEDGWQTRDLQIAPFIDYGVAWDSDNASPTSHKSSLSSIGIGLHWRPNANWLIRADYGHALDDIVTSTESLQDKGLQFRVEYRMAPATQL